jgi:hypothetical protein
MNKTIGKKFALNDVMHEHLKWHPNIKKKNLGKFIKKGKYREK